MPKVQSYDLDTKMAEICWFQDGTYYKGQQKLDDEWYYFDSRHFAIVTGWGGRLVVSGIANSSCRMQAQMEVSLNDCWFCLASGRPIQAGA